MLIVNATLKNIYLAVTNNEQYNKDHATENNNVFQDTDFKSKTS